MSKINYNPALRAQYQYLFDTCIIKSEKYVTVDAVISKILTGKNRYETVGFPLNIPWYFIGIIWKAAVISKPTFITVIR